MLEPFPDPTPTRTPPTPHGGGAGGAATAGTTQQTLPELNDLTEGRDAWSVTALADEAHVSEQAILKAIKEGRVEAHHVKGPRGPRWAIPDSSAQNYLESRKQRPLRSAPSVPTHTPNPTSHQPDPTIVHPSRIDHVAPSQVGATSTSVVQLQEENRRLRVQLEALVYAHRKLLDTLNQS